MRPSRTHAFIYMRVLLLAGIVWTASILYSASDWEQSNSHFKAINIRYIIQIWRPHAHCCSGANENMLSSK